MLYGFKQSRLRLLKFKGSETGKTQTNYFKHEVHTQQTVTRRKTCLLVYLVRNREFFFRVQEWRLASYANEFLQSSKLITKKALKVGYRITYARILIYFGRKICCGINCILRCVELLVLIVGSIIFKTICSDYTVCVPWELNNYVEKIITCCCFVLDQHFATNTISLKLNQNAFLL